MTLSETYFYILILAYVAFAIWIITFSEDLKNNRIFNTYLRISILVGLVGVLMELFDWTYFCQYNCLLITFSPFITILSTKGLTILYQKIFKEEPFAVYDFGLIDGIWVRNKGNIKRRFYYAIYSVSVMILPVGLIGGLFILVEKNVC